MFSNIFKIFVDELLEGLSLSKVLIFTTWIRKTQQYTVITLIYLIFVFVALVTSFPLSDVNM